jgi:hypothetical protein
MAGGLGPKGRGNQGEDPRMTITEQLAKALRASVDFYVTRCPYGPDEPDAYQSLPPSGLNAFRKARAALAAYEASKAEGQGEGGPLE